MITADQILCHLIGDYIIQSDWMAQEKTKKNLAAATHAASYTIPFMFLTTNIYALLIICLTHFLIDRFRLARYICFVKNMLSPKEYRYKWSEAKGTGYKDSSPAWLSVWLLIIADNTMHILINGLALSLTN